MPRYSPIIPAELDWSDGRPHCRRHRDIYYSREGGLAETRHVFLRGNGLPGRWAGRDRFTIGETGFGTGLNFLTTLEAWRAEGPGDARLHYLAVEKYPLRRADLVQALAAFPSLADPAGALIAQYPPLVGAAHRLEFDHGRVVLTLLFGDATTMLAGLDAGVDAWFLDGFAPARNPDLWTASLFAELARLSRPGSTVATFTAAGQVRRGLCAAGFEIDKDRGYGHKRDMLRGYFSGADGQADERPWFRYPAELAPTQRVVIIGAGIAGCSAAAAIARGGREVLLIDGAAEVAAGASGNPGGVILPRLDLELSVEAAFHLAAYLYTTAWLRRLAGEQPDLPWHPVGVLQLVSAERRARLQGQDFPADLVEFVDAASAGEIAGVAVGREALFYPAAGWLAPADLCRRLVSAEAINLRLGRTVTALRRAEGRWQVDCDGRLATEADVVLIANGADAARLLDDVDLSLQAVRGQLALLRATPTSRALKLPVCGDGYLLPASGGSHVAGASYSVNDENLQPRAADESEILRRVDALLPALGAWRAEAGRVALRAATPDYLPLLGPLPDRDFYRRSYADLHHGRPADRYPAARYRPGLYISAGHGSRGLVTAPLAAALLAALICGEPLPLSRDLCAAVHPGRFLLRALKRGG